MEQEFLDALLHDLQGPLGRVRMLGELVARRTAALDEETRQLLAHIGASAAAAEGVLEALRRYAGVEGLPFRPERFPLSHAVDTAANLLEHQIQSSGGRVWHAGLPEVYGDRTQMVILFQELITNSLRFRSEEAPKVEISADSEDAPCWSIAVKDNGVGFGGMEPDRVFRPFAKTSAGSRRGIGLAICRHIARLHGGDILAIPAVQGTEFRFRLPMPS